MDCNIGFDYISWYGHPAYNKKQLISLFLKILKYLAIEAHTHPSG
jgi:hypothetical protein